MPVPQDFGLVDSSMKVKAESSTPLSVLAAASGFRNTQRTKNAMSPYFTTFGIAVLSIDCRVVERKELNLIYGVCLGPWSEPLLMRLT